MRNGDNGSTYIVDVKNRAGQVVGKKEVTNFVGLLDKGHKEGLRKIKTKALQLPSKENGMNAIFFARVRTNRGTFTATGDASPENVNPEIAPHLTRVAETRAVVRALRLATNTGAVAVEELGADFTGDVHADAMRFAGAQTSSNGNGASAAGGNQTDRSHDGEQRLQSNRSSENQRRFVYRLLGTRGLEGDKAAAYVKEQLGKSLYEATKEEVSGFIDRLKQESGGNGHDASAGA